MINIEELLNKFLLIEEDGKNTYLLDSLEDVYKKADDLNIKNFKIKYKKYSTDVNINPINNFQIYSDVTTDILEDIINKNTRVYFRINNFEDFKIFCNLITDIGIVWQEGQIPNQFYEDGWAYNRERTLLCISNNKKLTTSDIAEFVEYELSNNRYIFGDNYNLYKDESLDYNFL